MKIVSCDRRRIKREKNRKGNFIFRDSYDDFPVMIGQDFIRNSRGMFQMLSILYVNSYVTNLIDTIYVENDKVTYKFPARGRGNISSKKKRRPFDVSHNISHRFMSLGKLVITFNSSRDKTKFMLMV